MGACKTPLSNYPLVFTFFYFFKNFFYFTYYDSLSSKMEADGDFNMITEELENIATGLRKLITSADSSADASADVSGVGESATASSTTSFGTRRLFGGNDENQEEEEKRGGGASAASSADALDSRPLFDSVVSIKTKDSTSSADALHSATWACSGC